MLCYARKQKKRNRVCKGVFPLKAIPQKFHEFNERRKKKERKK